MPDADRPNWILRILDRLDHDTGDAAVLVLAGFVLGVIVFLMVTA